MKKPLIWIIDEEWSDYDLELKMFRQIYPEAEICFSKNDYLKDLESFGYKADIILAQIYVNLSKETIERLECCKGIAVYGGGYDRVDIKAAKQKGIKVTNVQGYCADELAEYVMAAIYNHNKDITAYKGIIAKGSWGAPAVKKYSHRVSNSTLLVIGCGTIGRTVAKYGKRQGMRVLGYDPNIAAENLQTENIIPVTLEEGLKTADYISINVKYTNKTEGFINKKYFKMMKPTAYLINTARGKIIIEEDLIDAVNSGLIAGACLDVISVEPPIGDELILSSENIIVTPHISYISKESFHTLKERTVKNAIDMYEGKEPLDWVNK